MKSIRHANITHPSQIVQIASTVEVKFHQGFIVRASLNPIAESFPSGDPLIPPN